MSKLSKAEKKANRYLTKRTFGIYRGLNLPIHLYILQVVLGIISTKVSLLYVPYYTKMQTGRNLDSDIIWNYVGFLLLMAVVAMIADVPSFYANAMVIRNLQKKLIKKMLRLPMKEYEQEAPSEMISHVTLDVEYANNLINSIVGFLTGIIAAYMSMREMSAINNILSYLVIPVVIYIFVAAWAEGKLAFLQERRQRLAYSETTGFFSEHLGNLLQIKQLNAQQAEKTFGMLSIDTIYRADLYTAFIGLFSSFISGATSTIIEILVFVLGAMKVRSGEIDLQALVAFYNYILIAYSNLNVLPSTYTDILRSNGTLYYVGGMVEMQEEDYKQKETMDRLDEDINFKNVSFSYDDKTILDDVSFTIPKGKVTALVGPNGSGKTTLFKLIDRFYIPDSGVILFGEEDVSNIKLKDWRQSIGFVLQDARLFNGSIRENIVYGMDREVSDEEVIAVAKRACAFDFIMENEEGLDFNVGDSGSRLSEGQKQRIAIARAMLIDPGYLLLDEATSNLDAYAKEGVMQSMLNLMKGRTTVLISHEADIVDMAEHVVVLNGGKVEFEGAREEAAKDSETYRALTGQA